MSASPAPAGLFALGDREVPRYGYGMGGVSRMAQQGPDRWEDAVQVLELAYDLGVRHFDTAHFYENGLANTLLKETFGSRREEVFIASKVGARSTPQGPFPMAAAQKPQELRESVEANLRTLGTDYLDMVYMRRMDFQPSLIAEGEQQIPLEDQIAALEDLRAEGKVRGFGLSHVTEDQVRRALPAGILAVQNIYNLLYRQDAPLVELSRQEGFAWIPYFPLGGGFANLPKVVENDVVRAVAQEQEATAQQVGLAWLLAQAPTVGLISGTGNPEHLKENLGAGDIRLTADQLARLDAVQA